MCLNYTCIIKHVRSEDKKEAGGKRVLKGISKLLDR